MFVIFSLLDPDPNAGTPFNRIQPGSGSTTLLPTVPDNRLDRAKDLLSGNLHVVLDLGKDGGLHVVALLSRPLAPHHQPGPLLHPAPNVGQDGVHLSLGDLGLGYSDYVFLENDRGSRVYRCKKLY
jgi:hypothetical protein